MVGTPHRLLILVLIVPRLQMLPLLSALVIGSALAAPQEVLIWSDEFNTLNLSKWKHEITMGGGGNWEFEYYINNRSNR